jgi:xanthine dehydrogenase accessory factor
MTKLSKLTIVIKGAGEMASAVAWRLYMANFKRILMLETTTPLAVRRKVAFCEALHDGSHTVEGVKAIMAGAIGDVPSAWEQGWIAVAADPQWLLPKKIRPNVVVDAILAKKNLGTRMEDAGLVIGLGPGFYAGNDVHMVIETNRGHDLGRIITTGSADTDAGLFETTRSIGDLVKAGEIIGTVAQQEIFSRIDGVIRGLIRSETTVTRGLKIGDVDPRGQKQHCYSISEKARAIGGSVLEAVLRVYN